MTIWATRLTYLFAIALCVASQPACGDEEPALPRLTALLPAEGAPSDVVDLLGQGFEGDERAVHFSATAAEVVFWQARRVRVRVPTTSAGQKNVVVTIDGRPSNALPFTIR